MKNMRFYIICLFQMLSISVFASDDWYRLLLKTGIEYECQIELRNDDVVVFRSVQNRRYQVPTSDVESIVKIEPVEVKETSRPHEKRFGVLLHIGGCTTWRGDNWGWSMNGGLQAGAANLFDRRIFLGAGVGVSSYYVNKPYIFVPLTMSLTIPFLLSSDAPFAGLDAGYGIAVKGAQRGGFNGGIRFGWLHRFESQTAVELSLNLTMQQATLSVTETIEGEDFIYSAQRILPQVGVRLAVLL